MIQVYAKMLAEKYNQYCYSTGQMFIFEIIIRDD